MSDSRDSLQLRAMSHVLLSERIRSQFEVQGEELRVFKLEREQALPGFFLGNLGFFPIGAFPEFLGFCGIRVMALSWFLF